ncbi:MULTISPECIES: AAA family ATPase [unclassified Gilliamella]|uniref:AAA family ATPase n=1 Tax=unclassified Gilliamella TaxID=2685620 RepID=UPI00226AF8A2|nr:MULTISPECIES: AAA family ATPase [unclassified Gilliamella]MCX8600772.1 ATP-binding protein [Gilliamella sp. B3722]MCX8607790.1 ATP-binding protein [Gilliamella sp. B3771]MCX8609992.1 ATP-binding protein [Gilliamella sp. B3891]MCX8612748.1 ATP-binding protein [Gilliamella sp. B3773]MCX8615980.1 ATP-binding protein [Gilliamella sp. B3770]
MIEEIIIRKYLKLQDISFKFSNNINVISGGNGTCKTSILYIISNSFKQPKLKNNPSLKVIKSLNQLINPKIESLAKAGLVTKQDNNEGKVFDIKYYDRSNPIPFRVKDDGMLNRYRIIPNYAKPKKENLPEIPIIYLGLPRLIPTGEIPDDTDVITIKKFLPQEYRDKYNELYNDLCNIEIAEILPQENIANIKKRPTFRSNIRGIDSNTISAGQDNIQILLTALLSLKYYYENSNQNNKCESVLLIDELDATLHPTLQYKILKIINDFSSNYKIQVFFTTHSLSLIEYSIKRACNILYLIDNTTPKTQNGSIILLPDPTLQNISLFLQNKIDDGKYKLKKIPVLTEDEEARIFLKEILNFKRKENDDFSKIETALHMGQFNIGAQTLKQMNNDEFFFRSLTPSITILDGDERPSNQDPEAYKQLKTSYSKKNIIFLPSNKSPEKLLFDYSLDIYDNDSDFWISDDVLNAQITKEYYRENIKREIEKINEIEKKYREENKSSNGEIRKKRKSHFNQNEIFFKLLLRHWLANDKNKTALDEFIHDLECSFKRVCTPNGINPNIWPN